MYFNLPAAPQNSMLKLLAPGSTLVRENISLFLPGHMSRRSQRWNLGVRGGLPEAIHFSWTGFFIPITGTLSSTKNEKTKNLERGRREHRPQHKAENNKRECESEGDRTKKWGREIERPRVRESERQRETEGQRDRETKRQSECITTDNHHVTEPDLNERPSPPDTWNRKRERNLRLRSSHYWTRWHRMCLPVHAQPNPYITAVRIWGHNIPVMG